MKNEMRYRGLFAVELALLPLIIAFKMILGTWAVCIPLIILAVCRAVMLIIKDKLSIGDHIIEAISDSIIIIFLGIYFSVLGYIPAWLVVIDAVLLVLYQLANIYFYTKPMPDMIEALDFCFLAFVFTTIISLTFVTKIDVVAKVSFIAIMFTCIIVASYKIYRFLNYYIINRKSKFQKERDKAEKKLQK